LKLLLGGTTPLLPCADLGLDRGKVLREALALRKDR
jgi:hypothetical protein